MNIQEAINNAKLGVNIINVATEIDIELREIQANIVSKYTSVVEDLKAILTLPEKPILHAANSNGKDSTLVLLAALEAYRQCISEGRIESTRPFIVTTIDTLVESMPMVFLTRYVKPLIQQYAVKHGIALDYQILSPELKDQFFMRWFGASKLISNATRASDCTTILKTDVANKYLKSIQQRFDGQLIISITGQRVSESANRSLNMAKQQVNNKTISKLLAEIECTDIGIKRFAPIRDWKDDEVFSFHKMAGCKPLLKSLLDDKSPITSYLDNHAVLLHLYGESSNDVCEVVVGSRNKGACGGTARFGCFSCTQVKNDKSAMNYSKLDRWRVLGSENALAVRDWLLRNSSSENARAFHAKAIDFTGNYRVCLQPNVLKSTLLEKATYFASQLAIDSQRHADEFKRLVEQGKEMDHAGYACIANDSSISPEIRSELLKMYRSAAQEPVFTCYSQEHALMQSLLWQKDGVAALPFRPLKIWDNVANGKRIPFPICNDDWEAKHGQISLSMKVPEARMLKFFTDEGESNFNPISQPPFLSYHQHDHSWLEEKFDCSKETVSKHGAQLEVTARKNEVIEIIKLKINGKTINSRSVLDMLSDEIIEQISKQPDMAPQVVPESVFKLALPNFVQSSFNAYPKRDVSPFSVLDGRKLRHKTERRRIKKGKVWVKGQTRAVFYKPELSHQEELNTSSKDRIALNFDSVINDTFNNHDLSEIEMEDTANIEINPEALTQWIEEGGIEQALNMHDDALSNAILTKTRIRKYYGTDVVRILLSSGGFSIKPKYQALFSQLLKRTELLGSIGAFDLMNYSGDKLDKHPQVVTMDQHRADKVKAVQHLRTLRNQTRAKRQTLALSVNCSEGGPLFESIRSDVDAFFADFNFAIQTAVSGLRVTMTGPQDHTELDATYKGKLALLWLNIHKDTNRNSKELLKILLPTSTATDLTRSGSALSIAKYINSKFDQIQNTLSDATKAFENAQFLLEGSRKAWEDFLRSELQVQHLSDQVQVREQFVSGLNALQELLESLTAIKQSRDTQHVVKAMTFNNRLKLMSLCA